MRTNLRYFVCVFSLYRNNPSGALRETCVLRVARSPHEEKEDNEQLREPMNQNISERRRDFRFENEWAKKFKVFPNTLISWCPKLFPFSFQFYLKKKTKEKLFSSTTHVERRRLSLQSSHNQLNSIYIKYCWLRKSHLSRATRERRKSCRTFSIASCATHVIFVLIHVSNACNWVFLRK